jgi:hypothetical protein
MSNYIKSTDFSAKDTLLTGNPLKIVSGTEIDDEFNAIQTAVNTKANANSANLTGTPTAPTASAGANTTQIATTAYVTSAGAVITTAYEAADTALASDLSDVEDALTALEAAFSTLYPVGSVYTNAAVATNPATLLGFGTWESFGTGKVLVGIDASQTEFDTLGETGGAKTHTLTVGEINHNHDSPAVLGQSSVAWSPLTAPYGTTGRNISTGGGGGANLSSRSTMWTGLPENSTATAHNNLQPYIVVYMWKRTA